MAWIQTDPSGNFHISFRFGGRKFKRSLKTKEEKQAQLKKLRLEETISLVESGRIELPPNVDIPTFFLSDGKLDGKIVVQKLSLQDLREKYFESLPPDGLEASTIKMMQIHFRTLIRHLGSHFSVDAIRPNQLQGFINSRAKDTGVRGRPVNSVTIKKEVATLRAIFNWAIQNDLLPASEFPSKGLRYPKLVEPPPFQTFEAVTKQTASLDPSDAEFQDLWGTVFLSLDEIEELLDHVKQTCIYPFVYPMFVFAAHTGARRSEIMRSQVVDIGKDLITIHECKRKKRQRTTRMVPISPRLRSALDEWFALKPPSPYTICHAGGEKSRIHIGQPIEATHADHYFSHAVAKSKFEHLRGWHVFRHSFCSNCAAKGIDQRVIDGWVGHTTEDMRRRYRHLFPSAQKAAFEAVFG